MLAPYDKDTTSFDQYSVEINQYPLIDRAEELRLGGLAQKGDQDAIDKLVLANLRFVVGTARKYQGQGLSLGELVNIGNVGLIKAARKFDPSKGVKFVSYAVWWIKQGIRQELKAAKHAVTVPSSHIDRQNTINLDARRYQRQGHSQDEAQRMAARDWYDRHREMATPEDADDFLEGLRMTELSIDARIGSSPDDPTHGERIMQEFLDPYSTHTVKTIRTTLAQTEAISEREKKILFLYFGIPHSQFNPDGLDLNLPEIAELLHVTRQRVQQLRAKACKTLGENHPEMKYLGDDIPDQQYSAESAYHSLPLRLVRT